MISEENKVADNELTDDFLKISAIIIQLKINKKPE